jgi:hypothetical protein
MSPLSPIKGYGGFAKKDMSGKLQLDTERMVQAAHIVLES